jgi:photosystem II stability/assembly factor-like uncharacterized protein
MKLSKFIALVAIIIFCGTLRAQETTEIPSYYHLLNTEKPNIHKIMDAYDGYYKTHEWVKNDYTRAYNSFVRSYPIYTFKTDGSPIIPKGNRFDLGIESRDEMPKKKSSAKAFTKEWKALPVKIERSDCYYTGQNGVVRSIAVHPTNSNIGLAGGLIGGIWRTSDKGLTWSESVIKNLPLIGLINKIVFAPSNPSVVYVASNAGILKSTDGGLSFAMTNIDYTSNFPNIDYGGDDFRKEYMFVDVSPTDENIVIASDINPNGLVSTVARSTDGGQNWNSNSNFGYKNFTIDVRFHPTNHNIAYTLILENGDINFYRSINGGLNFTKVTNGFANFTNPNNKEIRGRIALTIAQPDLVAYYLNVSDDGVGIYKSTDAGVSWGKTCCGSSTDIVNKSANARDYFGEGFSAVQIRWATTIAISDVNPNFVAAATNVQPRFSFDQMQTWYWTGSQTSIPARPRIVKNNSDNCGTEIHGDIQEMIITGNDIWVANDGGLAISEDGGVTFKERGDGLPITMALGFDMTPGERDVIVVAMDHNGVAVKDIDIYGGEWKPLGGGDASGASVNPIDDSWLYARPSGDNIFKRPAAGPSHGHPFYNSAQGINFGSGYRMRYNNVQVHPNEYYTLYTIDYNNYQVKKSIDNGVTWSSIKSLQSGNGSSYSEVKISPSNPDIVYVSDETSGSNTLHKSTNGGSSWSSILPNLTAGCKVRNIEISSNDPNTIWLSVNGYGSLLKVYKSSNGGTTWIDYSTGLEGHSIYSMIHQKGSNGGIYVGTLNGVYYRDNTLSNWENYGENLPGIGINFLKINYAKGIIRAATIRGIWENDIATASTPKAVISSSSQSTTCGNSTIEFASNSVISNSNKTFLWIFKGGVPSTSTKSRPSINYPLAGSYEVTLTVTDDNGTSTQTLTNHITVSGSCTANAEIAATDVIGLGTAACIQEASLDVEVYNKGFPTITTYSISMYFNDQPQEVRTVTTSLASGLTETVSFNNLDLTGVAKIEFIVSSPNGGSDNVSDNSIVSYIAANEILSPSVSIVSYSSAYNTQTPDKIFDGDINTIWHNNAPLPHEMVFDLNASYNISSLEMLNRQDNSNGMPKDVEIYTSNDGNTWTGPYNWTFDAVTSWQIATFANSAPFQYLKFKIISTISTFDACSIAEIKFLSCTDVLTIIDNVINDDSIKIFPNPTSQNLKIEGLQLGMKVRIMNSIGLLIYEGKSNLIPVSNYSSGTYFLQVIDGNEIIVKKWIKM